MTRSFPHHHFLSIDQLSSDDIEAIFKLSERYAGLNRSSHKKLDVLAGRMVINLFFEPSTRTRTSFEIAAKRLGADVVNIAIEHSSTRKGESLLDTVCNLDAMPIDALVVRHAEAGTPQSVAKHVKASVINAGDGINEHPTQALLDAMTIKRHKGTLQGVKVAICGDIAHSRVARSNMALLNKCGADVRVIAPPEFMPKDFDAHRFQAFTSMNEGLKDVDVIMMLRIQHERMTEGEFAMSLKDYHQRYGLDHGKLTAAKSNVIVLHPGPLNRDIEITSSLADDPHYSVIHEQVETGVAVRMAILDLLLHP